MAMPARRGISSRLRVFSVGLLVMVLTACGSDRDDRTERGTRGPLLSPDTLAAWMEREEEFVLLDIQPDSLFEAQHLPGSIHAGTRGVEALRAVLPFEPRIPIVVVNADGVRPAFETDLTAEAMAFGYPRVYWLDGGVEAWDRAGHPVNGFRVFPAP